MGSRLDIAKQVRRRHAPLLSSLARRAQNSRILITLCRGAPGQLRGRASAIDRNGLLEEVWSTGFAWNANEPVPARQYGLEDAAPWRS